ncbi:MAG: hypothetical protein VB068_03025, partial [Petrimonas sp.]|nr:hypothetical protein [Petrimonas sp.]
MFHEPDYEKVLKTISIEKASRVGLIITIPVFLVFTVPYVLIYDKGLSDLFEYFRNGISPAKIAIGFLLFTAAVVIGIVLHELIHGITWALFAKKGFKSIRFG